MGEDSGILSQDPFLARRSIKAPNAPRPPISTHDDSTPTLLLLRFVAGLHPARRSALPTPVDRSRLRLCPSPLALLSSASSVSKCVAVASRSSAWPGPTQSPGRGQRRSLGEGAPSSLRLRPHPPSLRPCACGGATGRAGGPPAEAAGRLLLHSKAHSFLRLSGFSCAKAPSLLTMTRSEGSDLRWS